MRRQHAPDLPSLLEAAAALSRRFGADATFSRAGGGNVSVKADGVLYIKPSGVPLASVTAESLMPLDMTPLLELASGTDGGLPGSDAVMLTAMAARLRDEGDRRPSVECLFHALIPRRFVLHTHPTIVNALGCAIDGKAIAAELFGDELLWVPYQDPGLPLARAVAAAREGFSERTGRDAPDTILLQNHGLIVAADQPGTVVQTSRAVSDAIGRHLERAGWRMAEQSVAAHQPAHPARPGLIERLRLALATALATEGRPAVVIFDDSAAAMVACGSAEGRELLRGGPLTPDQIVYAGSWPLWLDSRADDRHEPLQEAVRRAASAHERATGAPPIIVVAQDLGLFAAGVTARRATLALDVSLDAIRVGRGARRLGGVRPLAPPEREFIENWEAEAYRLAMATDHAVAEPAGSLP